MRILFVGLLLIQCFFTFSISAEESSPYVKLKRAALTVPDLDRAIVFYRDVIGFTLETDGELELKKDSVLFELFNLKPSQKIRRVLFSSTVEKRSLFVMQSNVVSEIAENAERSMALVLQTDDMESLIKRAKSHDFTVGAISKDVIMDSKAEFFEVVIIGPGGQAVLVYQIVQHNK